MDVVCGIYCIENLINHKKYIGQSIDIYRRWQDHKHELNGGRHRNIYLQRAWNKYAEPNFSFYILEQCDVEFLDKRETYYIDLFDCMNNHCGYNIESGGNSNKRLSEETKMKISKSKVGKYCGGDNPNAHPVYCPQLNRTFECISDVERAGIACGAAVRDCIKGRSNTAGTHPIIRERLTWKSVVRIKDVPIKADEHSRWGAIYCVELDRVFLGGPSQVERERVVSRTCVARCLKGERKSAGKHPITGAKLHWKIIDNNNTNLY